MSATSFPKTHLATPLPLTYSEQQGQKPAQIVRAATRILLERQIDERREFLFVRHPTKGWELPGGAVDPGETGIEAAHRELHEETGLTLDSDAPLNLIATIPVDAGVAGFWLDLVYHAVVEGDLLYPIGEPEFELRWMTLAEIQAATAVHDSYLFDLLEK